MVYDVLLVVSALFALFHLLKMKDKFAKVITLVLALSAGANLAPSVIIQKDGFYLFALAHLLVFFYVFHNEEFSLKKKVVLFSMGLIQFASIVSMLVPFEFTFFVMISAIITAIVFFYALLTDVQSYKEELGFMVILAAFGITYFLIGMNNTTGFAIG